MKSFCDWQMKQKNNDFLKTKELLSKGNSLKRKLYEKLEESKKLEEALIGRSKKKEENYVI